MSKRNKNINRRGKRNKNIRSGVTERAENIINIGHLTVISTLLKDFGYPQKINTIKLLAKEMTRNHVFYLYFGDSLGLKFAYYGKHEFLDFLKSDGLEGGVIYEAIKLSNKKAIVSTAPDHVSFSFLEDLPTVSKDTINFD